MVLILITVRDPGDKFAEILCTMDSRAIKLSSFTKGTHTRFSCGRQHRMFARYCIEGTTSSTYKLTCYAHSSVEACICQAATMCTLQPTMSPTQSAVNKTSHEDAEQEAQCRSNHLPRCFYVHIASTMSPTQSAVDKSLNAEAEKEAPNQNENPLKLIDHVKSIILFACKS